MTEWWDLPGPSRHLDAIERDLRAGLSILIQKPLTCPAGLPSSLARRVRTNELWVWRRLDWQERLVNETPVAFVLRQLAGDAYREGDAGALVVAAGACGNVVWIDGLTHRDWPAWAAFLDDFDHAVRGAPEDHPVVVLPLEGELASNRIPAYAAVRLHELREWIDRYDVGTFVWNHIRGRRIHHLHKMVAAAICVELSGTDSWLAERLCAAELKTLFAPFEILAKLACDREWSTPPVAGWSTGADERWDNRMRRTSCAAASAGDQREVIRRIWRAQVSVLFPFIEEARVRLLRELQQYWRVPFQTRFGVINDIEGLEISHLAMLARDNGAPRRTVRLLEGLSAMRHSLAHLTPVELRALEDTELLQMD